MSRNVRVSDNRFGLAELDSTLTVPAGASFTEVDSKINTETGGKGAGVGAADEIVIRIAVVGTMPAGSQVILLPTINGFGVISAITKNLGTVTDGVLTVRVNDNESLTDCDQIKVTYRFIQGGADYDVTGVALQVKKKPELTTLPAEKTTADLEWYIDPVSGSDESGDGSAAFPFKSFACLNLLPPVIENEVKIRPKAGSYSYFPTDPRFEFYGDGRINIDASGETYPVIAGPFTVNTVTPIGDPYFGYEMANDVQVTGSPGWSVDEHYPYFIHMTSGNWAGYVLPIWKNTADTIRTYADWYGLAPGDTFNIVDCPIVIDVPDRIYWRGNIAKAFDFSGVAYREAPATPVLLMCGVKIRANATRAKRNPFKVQDISAIFSFCSLINQDDTATEFNKCVLAVYNTILNNQPLDSSSFDNTSLTDWYGYATQVSQKEGDPRDNASPDIEAADFALALVNCRGGFWCGGGFQSYCMAGAFINWNTDFSDCGPTFIEQIGFNSPCVTMQSVGSLVIRAVYVEKGGQPCENSFGGTVFAEWFKGNTPQITANYALKQKDATRFIRNSVSDVTILGSVGAIEFPFNSGIHATWPAAGSSVNDTAGSIVLTNS